MTTPAQGNFSGPSSRQPDAGFEASGLSPAEAERLASSFKPSWEFDEAPFTQAAGAMGQGAGLDARQIQLLSGGAESAPHENGDARTVAAHAPPQRVETNEPEVSVIIDRSITSAEIEAQRAQQQQQAKPASVRPPVPVAAVSPFASPGFATPAFAPAAPQRVAPVMRGPRTADESLELPASLKKSNKGLFIGLGVAVAAAALVLVVHGAMSSSSDTAPTPTTAEAPTAVATAPAENAHPSIPPIPPPPVTTAPVPVAAQPAPIPSPIVSPPPPPPPPVQRAVPVAAPKPHPVAPPPVRHPAPRSPPKAAAGGIVRDNPF